MRVVHRTDPVVRTTQLKQLLVNPVTNSWPWSDITIFASLYLVIRLYRKSATPRGPIYIYLSEQVKFKPRLNLTQASIKKVSISSNFATFCKKKKVLASSKLFQNFDICDRLYARKIMELDFH